MDCRPLFRILDPDSPDPAARIFRVVHHVLAAVGIAIVFAETMRDVQAEYGAALAVGFYVIGAFFVAEYVLRLIAAPAAPGSEHLPPWRARYLWAVSFGGIFDLICALPGILILAERPWTDPVKEDTILLGRAVDGLTPGHKLIVRGVHAGDASHTKTGELAVLK